ncbi:MAG: patatin-like phospholipase family protein [Gemmatimonadaceae bacterium]
MDYITELAIDVLPWFGLRPDDSRDENRRKKIAFAAALEEVIEGFPDGHRIWTQGSDQARLELLVDVLYAHPPRAQEAARIVGCYPSFIRNLADLVRADQAGDHSLRTKVKRAVSRSESSASSDIEHSLLAEPRLVVQLAKQFQCAMPFAMVLHLELEEIAESRRQRRAPDEEATVTQLREELEMTARLLERQRLFGDADEKAEGNQSSSPQFASRTKELEERRRSIEQRLEQILNVQKERRKLNLKQEPSPPSGPEPTLTTPATPPAPPTPKPFRYSLRRALEENLLGLAFSGGGIRSATFNLGILQALGEMDLLRKVDYMSTVSGGGYIGSWLAAWIKRQPKGVRTVQQFLSPARSPNPEAEVVRPIRHLREYSNHITPQPGILSGDTWALISIWLRNTTLNQTVLVLFLAGVLLLPRGVFPRLFGISSTWALGSAFVLLAVACWCIASNLQSFDRRWKEAYDVGSPNTTPTFEQRRRVDSTRQGWIQVWIVLPLFLAAFFFSAALLKWMRPVLRPVLLPTMERPWAAAIVAAFVLFVALMFVQARGRYYRCFYEGDDAPKGWRKLKALAAITATAVLSSALGGLLLLILARIFSGWETRIASDIPSASAWGAIVFGVPALIFIISLVVVLQIGLLGRNFPDERREWWSRLGGWLWIYSLGWLVLFAIPIYGPLWIAKAGIWLTSAAGLAWISSTVGGIFAAKSAESGTPAGAPRSLRSAVRDLVATTAPYVFVAGLLLAVAIGTHILLIQIYHPTFMAAQGLPDFARLSGWHWRLVNPFENGWPILLSVGALLLSLLLAWRVGVNEFSMHHFYRNRLVRAYLGASRNRLERKPNRFTGFDLKDDVALAELRVTSEEPYIGPYPILNATLNVVKGGDLAHQERKAQSFTFTPYYCGYEFVDRAPEIKWNSDMTRDGYRPTETYAYPLSKGIHIGTASAISGAAVNPSMGHHSSPAAAFLLTMFNVRLGWWLGNPRHARNWRSSSPGVGLLYLLKELTGYTNDRSGHVNLSDGGHFENLGVYELVRRRCRYIIACDSEQDVALTFGSLGGVVRKCRTDFGVEIDINLNPIRKLTTAPYSQVHCVVGSITYPDGTRGKLLYLKSSLTGDEPADVREYHARQPLFPHQTTADQLFDESQFESYRTLGYHVATVTFRRAVEAPPSVRMEDLFSYLESLWFPPAPAVQDHFADHVLAYEALMERVRIDQNLGSFDGVFFPRLPASLGVPPSVDKRNAFYTCTAMMDLMQNVFIDLDLEENGIHPHNAGWIRIFHQWASQPVFREAWAITRETYGERFRRFCEAEFQLPY